ncbi:MAG: D-glycerate dehydrogenase [Rhodobacteraceae bacterium]|nr:MAG: D-glycerate dehydrogenase [Paracoccaceae bacterium]|tara:strand:+ start:624 stop:1610 length:987 start_codon:yes stop_codon:yes gene_type:complete
MSKQKPKVIVTRRLPAAVENRMIELFDVELNKDDIPMSRGEIAAAMMKADVLVPTISDIIDQKLLARAGDNLRLIASYGAGFDHIDVQTARQRGILVSNTPGVLTDDTADMTLALMLGVMRRFQEGSSLIQEKSWDGWSPSAMLGTRLGGKRLGILGMGRIGSAVADRAKAFGMEIHYHNRKKLHPALEEPTNAQYWESLEAMLQEIDVLSVNCPHTPSTFHMINSSRLSLMKKNAFIVNTSRGEVIDENALARALKNKQLAGAALDVFEARKEVNSQLRGLPNVMLLPHMGSATDEARIEMGEKVIINIKTFIDGHRPPDQVVPAML